jgi:hypothetical protein
MSSSVETFLNAVDVGDDSLAEELMNDMPDRVLQKAYMRTLCNVKNTDSPGKQDSDYRSMLAILERKPGSKGTSQKSSTRKRSR